MDIVNQLRELTFPSTKEEVAVLAEAAYNIYYSYVPLTDEDVKFFRPHKKVFDLLVDPKTTWQKKCKTLTQELVDKLVEVSLRYLDG